MYSTSTKREAPQFVEGATASNASAAQLQQPQHSQQQEQQSPQLLQQQRLLAQPMTRLQQQPSLQQPSGAASARSRRLKQCLLSIPERRPRRQEQRPEEGQQSERSNTKQVPLEERGERAHRSSAGPTVLSLASLAGSSENASNSHSRLGSSASLCSAVGKSSNRKSNTSAITSNSTNESSGSSSSGGSIGNRSSASGSVGVGSRLCVGGERQRLAEQSSARQTTEISRTGGTCRGQCRSGCARDVGSSSGADWTSGMPGSNSPSVVRQSCSSQSSYSVKHTSNPSSCNKVSEDAPGGGSSSAGAGGSEAQNTPQVRETLSRRGDTPHGHGAGTGGEPQAARGAPAGVAGMREFHDKTQQLTASSSKNAEAEAKSDSSEGRPSVITCSTEAAFTAVDSGAVPQSRLPQRGNAAKRLVARAQQKQHPHNLALPNSEAATTSTYVSEVEKSGSDMKGPQAPAAGLSDLRRRCSYSCSVTANSPAAAPLCKYKREVTPSLGGAAAADANAAATATKDAEPRGRKSGRDSIFWGAESLFWKIKKHGMPRSASHEPESNQDGSQREGTSESQGEEHKTPGKESVISPWWCREFFLHALHHPNKGGLVSRRRAAQTAAVTGPSRISRHVKGEEDTVDISAAAGGVPAATADEKDASAGFSVRPALARGASASSFADAGKTAGHRLATSKVRAREASAHGVATALLQSALVEVKSLPYRLRREWKCLLRARNTAHISHNQRMQRADEVRQAAVTQAEANSSDIARSAPAVSAAERRGERGVAATPVGSRNRATLPPQPYAESAPAVAGRFFPKRRRERLRELQAILLMRQVLPSRETRTRLVQHARRNINKGQDDFEQMAPLLSSRREQLLPCGSTFAVDCVQEPSAAAAHMHRRYLTAGRLLGGGSEAMVFAAVEMPPPQSHLYSILTDLIEWRRPDGQAASRSLSGNRTSAPFCTAAPPAARGQSSEDKSSRGASAGLTSTDVTGASPTGHAASAGKISDTGQPAATRDTRGVQKPQQRNRFGLPHDPRQREHTTGARSGAEQDLVSCSTRHTDASSTAVTTGSAKSSERSAVAGGGSCGRSAEGVAHRRSLSSSTDRSIPHQEWGRCWALKWFLCEPFLLYSRRKAEQESAVVDWLQMAFWRLLPLHSIRVDIVSQLGIAAPQWIGVIEGLPMVSPGDAQFSVLNRVAAVPLMLGDLLTLSPVDLSVDDRLYCVLRLIQIVASMHAMGVLHNDIKLENIFIGTDGTLHVGDLGTAIPFTGRPMGFQRIGTDVYLDPQSAQEYLEYERLLRPAETQQKQYSQERSNCGARRNTRLGNERGTSEAAAPRHKPQAGKAVHPYTTGIAAAREDAAVQPGKARTVEVGRGVAGVGVAGRTFADVIKRPGGGDSGSGTSSEAAGGDRGEVTLQTEQGDPRRPFRVVYTPMRDAWAAGIVCYYIWCGGLTPYNLHRAFVGELRGQDVIRFLARLPNAEKGNKLVFPLGSCPDGETHEVVEVRRIIQGLLEPNGALRKTPLEIVQESPLFSAYRGSLFGGEEKRGR